MDVFYKRTAPIFPKDLPGPYKGRVAPALPRNGGALVEKLLAGKSKGTEQPILLSGGSVGADTLAGAAALKAGHEVAHLYGHGASHAQPHSSPRSSLCRSPTSTQRATSSG